MAASTSTFARKDDLYQEAVLEFICQDMPEAWQRKYVDPAQSGPALARMILDAYLSDDHFEDRGASCPMIALPSDVQRGNPGVQGCVPAGDGNDGRGVRGQPRAVAAADAAAGAGAGGDGGRRDGAGAGGRRSGARPRGPRQRPATRPMRGRAGASTRRSRRRRSSAGLDSLATVIEQTGTTEPAMSDYVLDYLEVAVVRQRPRAAPSSARRSAGASSISAAPTPRCTAPACCGGLNARCERQERRADAGDPHRRHRAGRARRGRGRRDDHAARPTTIRVESGSSSASRAAPNSRCTSRRLAVVGRRGRLSRRRLASAASPRRRASSDR